MTAFVTLAGVYNTPDGSSDFGAERSRDRESMTTSRALDQFLASVEKRAFKIAQLGLRNDDDALDAVQDAMMKLVQSYGTRPEEEWRPLFYRILSNRVRDMQRRRVHGRYAGAGVHRSHRHLDDRRGNDPLRAVFRIGLGARDRATGIPPRDAGSARKPPVLR